MCRFYKWSVYGRWLFYDAKIRASARCALRKRQVNLQSKQTKNLFREGLHAPRQARHFARRCALMHDALVGAANDLRLCGAKRLERGLGVAAGDRFLDLADVA